MNINAKAKLACSVDGCSDDAKTKGLCGRHYMRIKRYGDPHYVTSNEQFRINCREAAVAKKAAKPTTYKKLHNRHEHRVVAEAMLGRPLKRGEIVHHKDGNRHNNAPDNLEIMSQAEHLRLHHQEMTIARFGDKHERA